MKKTPIVEKLYSVIFIIAIIMCVACVVYSYRAYDDIVETEKEIVDPTERAIQSNGRVVYTFLDKEWENGHNSLLFYSNHQDIHAYSDGVEVFSRVRADSIFGHTTGSAWNIFTVPTDTEMLTVEFTPVYSVVKDADVTFYVGDGTKLLLHKMQSGILNSIICLVIILVGFCLLVYWFVSNRTTTSLRELLYLGLFAMLLGVWSFTETDLAQMLIQNRTLGTLMGFTCIALMGPASVLFAKYFFKARDKYIHKLLVAYGIAVLAIAYILQAVGYMDMKQMAINIQMVIPLGFVYWVYGLIAMARRGDDRRKLIINTIGLIILSVSIGIDLVAYYNSRSSANKSGKFGFLIYMIVLGTETARQSMKHIEEVRMLGMYREMATKDMLTGCFNRNAYDADIKEITDPSEISVVLFDLNNLKVCNDTNGHAKGDEYLMVVSRMIRAYMERFGKVYRTGGDEFTVVMKKAKEKNVESQMEKMREECLSYFADEVDFGFQKNILAYACGYASFDPELDKNINATILRADKKMYENKKRIKEENAGE